MNRIRLNKSRWWEIPWRVSVNYFFWNWENLYFLGLSCLQLLTLGILPRNLSPTGPYSTFLPLLFCVSLEIGKEYITWYQNWILETKLNDKEIEYTNGYKKTWKDINIGDCLILRKNDIVPALGLLKKAGQEEEGKFNFSMLNGESTIQYIQVDDRMIPAGVEVLSDEIEFEVKECGFYPVSQETVVKSETQFEKLFQRLVLWDLIPYLLTFIIFYVNHKLQSYSLSECLYLSLQGLILFNGIIPFSAKIWLLFIRNLQALKYKDYVYSANTIDELVQIEHLIVDKTGTLTQNSLKIAYYFDIDTLSFQSIDTLLPSSSFALILKLCINKYNDKYDTHEDEIIDHQIISTLPSTIAKSYSQYRFNATRKRSSVITDNGYIYTKGSISSLRPLLKPESLQNFNLALDNYSQTFPHCRLLVYAQRQLNNTHIITDDLEKDLTFVGCIAFIDEYQDDLEQTIHWLQSKNIHISMATGDNRITALALAKNIGLISDSTLILSGSQIRTAAPPITNIIGYDMTAEDKAHLTKLLRHNHTCVGTIGDGWNDLEMMKESSVSIGLNNKLFPCPSFLISKFSQVPMLFSQISYPSFIRNYQALDSTFYRAAFIGMLIFLTMDNKVLLFDGFITKAFTFLWPTLNLLLLSFEPLSSTSPLFDISQTILFGFQSAFPILLCSTTSSFFIPLGTIILINSYTMFYTSISIPALLAQTSSILIYILYKYISTHF